MGRRPPRANAGSAATDSLLAVPAARSMSEDATNWDSHPVNTIIWRDDIDTRRRCISICCQLMRMQRDIVHRKIHGPGSGMAR